MDINESIQQIAKRYIEAKGHIATEEATKTALIMPFIQALGYDIWNPMEVVPEFDAVIPGTKKGDKIDYVIKKNGEPIILIECKWHGRELDINQESQLMHYFHAIPGKQIAILTNGVQYRFYADLDAENKMDSKPFLQFDITKISDSIIKALQHYAKSEFSIENIIPIAAESRYTNEIKRIFIDSLNDEPDDDFVNTLARKVYEGKLTERMKEKFREIVKKALNQFVTDRINDRLSAALKDEGKAQTARDDKQASNKSEGEDKDGDEWDKTYDLEADGYVMIKALLRKTIDVSKVRRYSTKASCGIFLGWNGYGKIICRFFFNDTENLSIIIFDENRNETKHELKNVDEIFSYEDEIIKNTIAIDKMPKISKRNKGHDDSEEVAVVVTDGEYHMQ